MSLRRLSWLLLPALLGACDREEPIGIGGELLPGEAVRTFEVTLNAADYLLRDTSFALYGSVESADFTLLARAYAGALNSNTFARFDIPEIIAVIDSLRQSRTDSMPTYLRGEILMMIDSIATEGPTVNRVGAFTFAEAWDPDTANWQFRLPGVPWTVPGGTPGVMLDEATYVRTDTMILKVDSATLRAWRDTTNATRGALLMLLDSPARMRGTIPRLRLYARSRFKPDTTFVVFANAPQSRFVFEPRPDTVASDIRVNGTPSWRSFLQFRPNLRNLQVSCGSGCSTTLVQTEITRAELELQPISPRAGFDIELPSPPYAFSALVTPLIPLQRSPIGFEWGTVNRTVTRADFRDGAAPLRIDITGYMRQLVQDTTSDGSTGRTEWLMLLNKSPRTFGYARFAASPRLRLVLSTASQVQLP